MAWDDEIVTIVRHMISDVDTPQKYTDDRISEGILVAMQQINSFLSFPVTFVPDISNGSLAPDPTVAPNRDEAFINLTALKTACILVRGESRIASAQSIGIRDGTSALDLRRDPRLAQLMISTFCDQFDQAVWDYQLGGGLVGEAIVGPYKSGYEGYGGCGYGRSRDGWGY